MSTSGKTFILRGVEDGAQFLDAKRKKGFGGVKKDKAA